MVPSVEPPSTTIISSTHSRLIFGTTTWMASISFRASMAKVVFISDNFDVGKGEDHLSVFLQELPFAFDNAVLEMPRKHQKIIRLERSSVGFGDDGNPCTWCKAAELLRIDIGNGENVAGSEPAKLEQDVALGRSTVSD